MSPAEKRVSQTIEEKVRAALDALSIPYEVIPCDPELADTAAFCAHYGYAPGNSGNTILVASKREPVSYAACLITATTRLDVNHAVRRLMGVRRLSFATAEQTMAVTGMQIGGVTVFGLPADLPIYIDSRVMELDSVILGGGGRSSKIRLSPRMLERLPNATVAPGLARDA